MNPLATLDMLILECPLCMNKNIVYHVNWCAMTCLHCKETIHNPFHESCNGSEFCHEMVRII